MQSSVTKINSDLSNFADILEGYDKKLKAHVSDLRIDGYTYMQANVQQSAFIGYYDQISDELDIIVQDMEMRLKVAKFKVLKNIQQNSAKDHTEKVLGMLIEGDPLVITTAKALLEVKERYLKSKSIVLAFQQRGFSLNNLVKMRQAEFHDEMIYIG